MDGAVEQAETEEEGDQRRTNRRQDLEGQRGEEGHPQCAHGRDPELVIGPFERPTTGPDATEGTQGG